jgi:hypothetical protein
MPIGSESEATEILAAFRSKENAEKWYADMTLPNGWRYLGHGMYRCAFLSPSGVVYKIETGNRISRLQNNMTEYERILELRFSDVVEKARVIIPKAWLYSVGKRNVLAMEYMDGDWASGYHSLSACDCGDRFGNTCAYTQFAIIERYLNMSDVHGGNAVFIPAQKRWALVDLGA